MPLDKFFKGKAQQVRRNMQRPMAFGSTADQAAKFPTSKTTGMSRRKALRSGPRKAAIV